VAQSRKVNPKTFFGELKRRNVYKVAIACAAVAWLLMQVATQVFPFLETLNWAIRLVIMLIGFPIALVIACVFELTPEGLKRTEFADELPRKSITLSAVVIPLPAADPNDAPSANDKELATNMRLVSLTLVHGLSVAAKDGVQSRALGQLLARLGKGSQAQRDSA
jgi:hypothetical protein